MCTHVLHGLHVEVRGQFCVISFVFFYIYMGSGDWTQIIKLAWWTLLSAEPKKYFLKGIYIRSQHPEMKDEWHSSLELWVKESSLFTNKSMVQTYYLVWITSQWSLCVGDRTLYHAALSGLYPWHTVRSVVIDQGWETGCAGTGRRMYVHLRPAWSTYWASRPPGLHREIISQK